MVESETTRGIVNLRLHVTAEVFVAWDIKHVSDLHILEWVFYFFRAGRFGIANNFESHEDACQISDGEKDERFACAVEAESRGKASP